MIDRLSIRDFAIIDRLEVEWARGLNVVTGETGAGKSILVDAVGALLGDRVGPEVVRSGADRAFVEGTWTLIEPTGPELARVLEEFGVEPEEGVLILSREIAGSGGRGGARVNGRAVPLSVLQALGEQLVDIHGQSQHMALLRSREQLDYLDRYAGLLAERANVATLVNALRESRERLRTLRAADREAAREQEVLRFQAAEIEAASPRPGEEAELHALQGRLRNAERLRRAARAAYAALAGDGLPGDAAGALDLLGQALAACQVAAEMDPTLQPRVDELTALAETIESVSRSLRHYAEEIEEDPEALEATEGRLLALADLRRKYGDTIEDVLVYLEEARQRLDRYARRDEDLARLSHEVQALEGVLGEAAGSLSSRRLSAGSTLGTAVESELADLGMEGARVVVSLTQLEQPDGVPVGGRRLECQATGLDRVDILLAANRGEEPRPLARVASGGELARIALALKTILARAETRGTLIFDEVDMGVGGRTAPVVGQKLAALAEAGHQVLCVTHMPQVAAYATKHWHVRKAPAADGTRVTAEVVPLDLTERLRELAAMLAGAVSDQALRSAAELVERAAAGRLPPTNRVAATADAGANGPAERDAGPGAPGAAPVRRPRRTSPPASRLPGA